MVGSNLSSKNAASRQAARSRRKGTRPFRIRLILLFSFLSLLVVGYFVVVVKFFYHQSATSDRILPRKAPMLQNTTTVQAKTGDLSKYSANTAHKRPRYSDWRDLAVNLAALPAHEILEILKTKDPFGVRQFEERLKQTESDRQAILQLEDIKSIFPCPTDERITLPDQRNHKKSKMYREGLNQLNQNKEDFVFLFFQHLRKAGGTNFCTLAQHNLIKPQVPQ
jgi:hypothetical protein